MSNQALARTYRPRHFEDMATQEHVSATLRAAVSQGRVAHAYMFCGPRGVGKTTAARVLAMALNCPRRHPNGEPCGVCESCEKIWSGKTSLDVVEIDAASNRGVDDARELRERAMYAPTEPDRFKVYIIDEAHMLTREAWNALLKVLEEPPPRVIFIFATTEPQKIQQAAAPILSRCQRFDFHRISIDGIVDRLVRIVSEEGVSAEPAALIAIARRADGGMRDALSLLDQVISFSGATVSSQDVTQVLGLVPDELYVDLFGILADRNVPGVFSFVQNSVIGAGHDLSEFYRGLADALRAMLVTVAEGTDNIDVHESLKPRYTELAARFSFGDLLRMLGHVAELDTEGRFRKSANPRTALEALLLRWVYLDRTVHLDLVLRGVEPPPSRRVELAAGEITNSTGKIPESFAVRPAAGESPLKKDASSAKSALREPHAVRSAFAALLGSPKIPAGIGFFLQAARIEEEVGDTVGIEMPAGPGLEHMRDAVVKRQVEDALSHELGRRITIDVRANSSDASLQPERITSERVKSEQLLRMSKEEPILGRAVKDWDLELAD